MKRDTDGSFQSLQSSTGDSAGGEEPAEEDEEEIDLAIDAMEETEVLQTEER